MRRLIITLSLCLLFSFQAYGQIDAKSAASSGAAATADSVGNIITLGSDDEDVDGKIVWIDADGGTGDMEISSDGLTFSGFGGGVDVNGDFTAGTIISDGVLTALGAFTSIGIDDNADATAITIAVTTEKVTLSATLDVESDFTINPVVADQETPSLVIGADGDSDGSVVADRGLTVAITQNANPGLASWGFSIANGAGNNMFKFISGANSFTFTPGSAQIISSSSVNDLIDLDAALWKTGENDIRTDPDVGAAGTFTSGDDGDQDTTFVNGILRILTVVGITATNPGGQGDSPLTADINEVSTVGAGDDAVTLPGAIAGRAVTIINTSGNQLEVWPASGDDAGAGANTAVTIAAGANATYVAFNTTTWVVRSSG